MVLQHAAIEGHIILVPGLAAPHQVVCQWLHAPICLLGPSLSHVLGQPGHLLPRQHGHQGPYVDAVEHLQDRVWVLLQGMQAVPCRVLTFGLESGLGWCLAAYKELTVHVVPQQPPCAEWVHAAGLSSAAVS